MTNTDQNVPRRPTWQWWVLLFILLAVSFEGAVCLLAPQPSPAIAIVLGALSFAFSLHYFSVTIPIHNVRFGISDGDLKLRLKSLVGRAVSHAMFVMGAGLAIILFAGAVVILHQYHFECLACGAVTLYCVSAIAMVWCIGHYAFTFRHWPDDVDKIVAEYDTKKKS